MPSSPHTHTHYQHSPFFVSVVGVHEEFVQLAATAARVLDPVPSNRPKRPTCLYPSLWLAYHDGRWQSSSVVCAVVLLFSTPPPVARQDLLRTHTTNPHREAGLRYTTATSRWSRTEIDLLSLLALCYPAVVRAGVS